MTNKRIGLVAIQAVCILVCIFAGFIIMGEADQLSELQFFAWKGAAAAVFALSVMFCKWAWRKEKEL